MHEELSCRLAIELLVKVLGLKDLPAATKKELQIYGEITGDTGNRFDLEYKADKY